MALVVIEKAADQEFQMISSLLGFPTFDGQVVYHQGKCKYQACIHNSNSFSHLHFGWVLIGRVV